MNADCVIDYRSPIDNRKRLLNQQGNLFAAAFQSTWDGLRDFPQRFMLGVGQGAEAFLRDIEGVRRGRVYAHG